jgi:hypothetical protein
LTGWAKDSFTGPRIRTSGCSSAGIGGACPAASLNRIKVVIKIAITIIIAFFISVSVLNVLKRQLTQ